MAKIDDAIVRLEKSGIDNASALADLIAAGNTEIQQVADLLKQSNPDTDALADRLNTVGDAFDTAIASAKAAKAMLDSDDPAATPADGGGTSGGDNSGEPQIHNVGP